MFKKYEPKPNRLRATIEKNIFLNRFRPLVEDLATFENPAEPIKELYKAIKEESKMLDFLKFSSGE